MHLIKMMCCTHTEKRIAALTKSVSHETQNEYQTEHPITAEHRVRVRYRPPNEVHCWASETVTSPELYTGYRSR